MIRVDDRHVAVFVNGRRRLLVLPAPTGGRVRVPVKAMWSR